MNMPMGRFVKDASGKRIAVVLAMREYRKILEELEELESIRAYDAAKADRNEVIPFAQAIQEIGLRRK